MVNNNDFISFTQASAGLKFTPATNSVASGSFTVQASLSNTDTLLGRQSGTATIRRQRSE